MRGPRMNGIGQDLRFGCWAEVVEGLQASFLDGCVGLASGSHLVRDPNFRTMGRQAEGLAEGGVRPGTHEQIDT